VPDAPTTVARSDTLVGGPPPPVPPPEGPPPDRRVGAGMLLGIVVVALAVAGALLAWYLTHRHHHHSSPATTTVVVRTTPTVTKVTVPRVVGLTEPKALVKLASLGLRPKEVYRATKKPTGLVVSQNPQEATSVKKGTQVTLVIDRGAPKVAVPNVRGLSLSAAQAKLSALGLSATQTQVTSTKPAGTVVDEAPAPGTSLAKGSSVTLSVAKAPATTTTPTTTSATTAATTTTAAPGGGATTTSTRTGATTTTRTPPQPTNATVPTVTGQTEQAAVHAFANAGILASIVFVPGTDPLGTVEQQAKPGGSLVRYHSHVQINISRGPSNNPLESVPNIVGMTLQQAVSTLNSHSLRLIYVKYTVTSSAQAGKIVQQSPLQGGRAPQNGQVVAFLGAFR